MLAIWSQQSSGVSGYAGDGPGIGMVIALAAAIVGADHVSDEFARYLCQRTSGLPLAVEELLALLQARGSLVRRDGRWSRRSLDELDVPTGIRDSVLERASRLSANARALIEAASVLQIAVPFEVLAATATLAREGLLPSVQEALESALLVETQGRDGLGFRHLLGAFDWVRSHHMWVTRVGGAMLIFVGLLFIVVNLALSRLSQRLEVRESRRTSGPTLKPALSDQAVNAARRQASELMRWSALALLRA
jgi:hypothetical protein